MLSTRYSRLSFALLVLLSFYSINIPTVSADSVGGIGIKDSPSPTQEEQEAEDAKEEVKKESRISIGGLTIGKGHSRSHKSNDSEETVRMKKEMVAAIRAVNEKKYSTAIRVMKKLHKEHPESYALMKWLLIYENQAGLYEESMAHIHSLRASFPLSKKEIEEDIEIAYYMADNARHMNDDKTFDESLKKMKEKVSGMKPEYLIENIPARDIYNTLIKYQEIMKKEGKGRSDGTFAVRGETEAVWRTVPPSRREHLDNFFGYDIDDLTYVYGRRFNRKELLRAYGKRQENSERKESKEQSTHAIEIANRRF